MFSIVIPSWNNLPHLKLAVESLLRNSSAEHEIIVHLNEGSDGSLEWVKAQGIRYTHTDKNVGVCMSVNHLMAQTSHEWVLYMNDDMVAAPGWDTAFVHALKTCDTDLALFFGTLIQPVTGGHPDIIKCNFGETPATFDEAAFLRDYLQAARGDKEGMAMQPTLVHKKWWAILGGYSLEFSPGMSSDDDLLMKFWVAGCRNFRMVGASRFYHFGMASTGRITHNQGGHIFTMKWGITQREFYRNYISSLRNKDGGNTPENPHNAVRPTWLGKLRRVRYALKRNYPLDGIEAWDPAPGQGYWGKG
ncbi:MAG: glycosyltransferase family 2 protein [Chloroflexi bacterium]|nr:glycosyltransferase family 2 protein [Chloroflexota bacterium]MBM3152740.1 glycosyltransferase family 2 protein [Chloroflexota bacterium]